MALRPKVKKRERRMAAFRALIDWVRYAGGDQALQSIDSRPDS
jgi:hypothetical protein